MMSENCKAGGEPHLTLKQIVHVKENTIYLGLILVKRLTWKQHVNNLHVKSLPAVDLIKHLSHLTWKADRKTLLHLYMALV